MNSQGVRTADTWNNRKRLGKQPKLYVFSIVSLATVAMVGCGKPPMQSVTGVVKLNGEPVGNCKVGFFPDVEKFDTNRHGFGFGVTDDEGNFEIQHPQGEKGIWAGEYKVTFVAWVDRNGKPLAIDIKPSEIEGGVKNLFPDEYEAPSTTQERVTVTSGVNTFEFNVTTNS